MSWGKHYWKDVATIAVLQLAMLLMDYLYNKGKFTWEFQSGWKSLFYHVLFFLVVLFVAGPVVFRFTANRISEFRTQRR